ncbi:hypothetical protein [Nocardioides nanhaiensis]|uniref:Uncharacterized protein n=1 Tax=Nocardioides nanhaiensis TaxID=1476871 RepID=A0ABP8VYC0_9ACTN
MTTTVPVNAEATREAVAEMLADESRVKIRPTSGQKRALTRSRYVASSGKVAGGRVRKTG